MSLNESINKEEQTLKTNSGRIIQTPEDFRKLHKTLRVGEYLSDFAFAGGAGILLTYAYENYYSFHNYSHATFEMGVYIGAFVTAGLGILSRCVGSAIRQEWNNKLKGLNRPSLEDI